MKFIGTKELETERLLLRKATIKDAEKAFEEWCSKSEVEKYVTWSKHKNVDVTKNLFRIWEEDYKDLSTFRWIVELKDTKEESRWRTKYSAGFSESWWRRLRW